MPVDRSRFAKELSSPERYELTGSPCVKVCRLEDGVCVGCRRTKQEIKLWARLSNQEKDGIVKRISGVG